jgi:hypothetical protein
VPRAVPSPMFTAPCSALGKSQVTTSRCPRRTHRRDTKTSSAALGDGPREPREQRRRLINVARVVCNEYPTRLVCVALGVSRATLLRKPTMTTDLPRRIAVRRLSDNERVEVLKLTRGCHLTLLATRAIRRNDLNDDLYEVFKSCDIPRDPMARRATSCTRPRARATTIPSMFRPVPY